MEIIALIPARAGSKRVQGKNIKPLAGHPLLAYTITAAHDAGVFRGIYVSTESAEIADIAWYYGADVIERSAKYATDESPDEEWITEALATMKDEKITHFAILRPTSPFRTGQTIVEAIDIYRKRRASWLKALSPVEQHPGKIWSYASSGDLLIPWDGVSDHCRPTQTLSKAWVQNGSLEIRPVDKPTFSAVITGYFTVDHEGYDINTERDWIYAEYLINHDRVKLPVINCEPYRRGRTWE